MDKKIHPFLKTELTRLNVSDQRQENICLKRAHVGKNLMVEW